MRKPLLLSLAFHAVVVLCALWVARRQPPSPKPPIPFEVALEGSSRGSGPRGAPAPRARPVPRHDHSRKPPALKDLAPLAREPLPSTGETSVNGAESPTGIETGAGGGRGGPPDAYDVARGMDIRREGMLYGFFEALWHRIDRVTPYPTDFAQKRITGTVTVHVGVDRRGVFSGRFLRVDASDPLLETYVMAALTHALRDPLPEKLWSDRDEMQLATRFSFTIFGPGESPPEPETPHFKNVLQFTRSSYVDPKLNQEFERLVTHYMPPILPIPGGFYIDFYRAYQLVRNYGKPDEEEKRDRRLENLREQWDEVVRKQGQ